MPVSPSGGPSSSTVKLQKILDLCRLFGDTKPTLDVGGSANEPFLTCCNDVMNAICGVNFPHKWNEVVLPPFYTNSLQQDYAVLDGNGSSITNLSWLQRGIVVDINNTAIPKPFREVEVGRQLPQATGSQYNFLTSSPLFLVNWFPNQSLYYGTWGAGVTGSASFGNNPVPGSVYTDPVGASVSTASWASTSGGQITFVLNYIPNGTVPGSSLTVSGAFPKLYNGTFEIVSVTNFNVVVTATSNPGAYQIGGIVGSPNSAMPSNPITQIEDAYGNLLVLTKYGTEGTAAPFLAPNAPPGTSVSGTGATTVWTVADPNGYGFRITPVPGQTGVVWEFDLVGQMKPVRFTNLSQTLYPLPDEFETNFRMGVVAQLYRYSPLKEIRAKFQDAWQLWLASLTELRSKQDREIEENRFTLSRGIMGGGRNSAFPGPAWPFNSPR
jgi:hypothetical protein